MSSRLVHIWHDAKGKILAVGHCPDGNQSKMRAIPLAGKGGGVLQEHVAEEAMSNLHETHRVNVKKGTFRPTK